MQSGSSSPGRGFQVTFRGDTVVLTLYGYERNGDANWWLATGTLDSTSSQVTMSLETYEEGTALAGSFRNASSAGSAGLVTIRFDTISTGVICLPGEDCKSISYFGF